jgi:hypothetical protein
MPKAKQPRAINIFIVAEQFRFASKLATIIPLTDLAFAGFLPVMPTAAMTCSAFALEVYLKCLVRMERKPIKRGHGLIALFNQLGRRNQSSIKRYWRANSEPAREAVEEIYGRDGTPAPKFDFNFVMTASDDAFVSLRYIYERGVDQAKGWLADAVVEGARQTILDKHPDWENARQTSPLPITNIPTINVGPTFRVH